MVSHCLIFAVGELLCQEVKNFEGRFCPGTNAGRARTHILNLNVREKKPLGRRVRHAADAQGPLSEERERERARSSRTKTNC